MSFDLGGAQLYSSTQTRFSHTFAPHPTKAKQLLIAIQDSLETLHDPIMADSAVTDPTLAAELKKKRTFRTFSYRGVGLDNLLDMGNEEFIELVHARARRKFNRGLKRRPMGLIKKLRKAKKEALPNEKPAVVKTHLRDMIIVPEMIGSVIGIYNGKTFNSVEIKPEMTGHYLAEFSCSYKPVKHGRPGIGATHSSRFIPLK
ncbi:hypothetical protein SCLCIDRAFT_1222440 [Scleroderma citrinum Foug A]|uniref:40S ribosomal protein S15 n=1 Tax=Scleroderma citrinum Foug A TaxID=1036808 RepID=A0A0C2ZMQ4_9AGAM|nr:hypothetical protein SCLCIDRAFT_1222440 [Scleroderma citrinum Foug A]